MSRCHTSPIPGHTCALPASYLVQYCSYLLIPVMPHLNHTCSMLPNTWGHTSPIPGHTCSNLLCTWSYLSNTAHTCPIPYHTCSYLVIPVPYCTYLPPYPGHTWSCLPGHASPILGQYCSYLVIPVHTCPRTCYIPALYLVHTWSYQSHTWSYLFNTGHTWPYQITPATVATSVRMCMFVHVCTHVCICTYLCSKRVFVGNLLNAVAMWWYGKVKLALVPGSRD